MNGDPVVRGFLMAAACFVVAALPAGAADLVLVNLDSGTGAGLDDPTPAPPIGGNPGTTRGAQRVNVYNLATQIWGAVLDSDVDIFIGATFTPLPCSSTGAVLGAAGPTSVFANFTNAGVADTWYTGAEADALAGADIDPGVIDIISFFNSDVDDDDPNCLSGRSWYYGLENQEAGDIDFLTVVLHEIAHGLGNIEFASESTGELFFGLPDIYMTNMLDRTTDKFWQDMTDAERLASQVNTGNLVWAGGAVTAIASSVLAKQPTVGVKGTHGFQDEYRAQPATFGPGYRAEDCEEDSNSESDSDSSALEPKPVKGKVVLADDGAGATDGCAPIASNVHGKVALVDRGGCDSTQKVANAEAAGAKGVIVANDVPGGGPADVRGFSTTIGIPAMGVSFEDGSAMKARLPQLAAEFSCDPTLRAGASPEGLVRLYAPNVVQPGSSKVHWDPAVLPNLLMEPFINSDLESATDLDLTPFLFMDIGWSLLP